MFSRHVYLGLLILTIVISCDLKGNKSISENDLSQFAPAVEPEKYRPLFHFTPEKNWTNDPNGLVYYDGKYHLFYQYNPFGNQWGHMSWGHAVSGDLVDWEHLPVALYEADGIMIFSGSAVIDKWNTCGLCEPGEECMVAIYTSHIEGKAQHQSIAYSMDSGRSWVKYEGNPVLDLGMRDFRDPKVFWYAPDNKWVMVVSHPLEYKVEFYQSSNLRVWERTGEFGGYGDVSKIWECPDLSKVKIRGSDDYKWVLIISSGSQYGDYTGMQYFIGEFDGTAFIADDPINEPRWLDYGKDFYAAVTYNNLPEGQDPILVGWVNNWRYAGTIPTSRWRGMMSIPRVLTLERVEDRLELFQIPVKGVIEALEEEKAWQYVNHRVKGNDSLLDEVQAGSFRVSLIIRNLNANKFGIEIFRNDHERTNIGYDDQNKLLFIDRRQSGNIDFHQAFPSVEYAPLVLEDGMLMLDIYADQSVVEVFAQGGRIVLTDQVFPLETDHGMKLYAEGGEVQVKDLKIWKVK